MDLPTFPSIAPEVWGRSFWEFLDAIVAVYPREKPSAEHRAAAQNLFQSLQHLLPCPTCRRHYQEFVRTHPLDLSSRRSLLDFYFNLKRDIAIRTGKPFPFGSSEDLWQNITRRLRLVRNMPTLAPMARTPFTQKAAAARTGRPPFRVPVRANATVASVKKGCGCGKK